MPNTSVKRPGAAGHSLRLIDGSNNIRVLLIDEKVVGEVYRKLGEREWSWWVGAKESTEPLPRRSMAEISMLVYARQHVQELVSHDWEDDPDRIYGVDGWKSGGRGRKGGGVPGEAP